MTQRTSEAARGVLLVSGAVAAMAHVPVIGPHLEEAPYMGVLFAVFVGACTGITFLALLSPSRRIYLAAAVLCGAGVVTYAATRLVAFPQLADDVGNWTEPLGVLSVLAETSVALSAAFLLRGPRHKNAPVVAAA